VAVAALAGLPAAAQLPVGSAVQLLQAALLQGFEEVVTLVCQQQAAHAIDAAAFTTLLLTAVQQQQHEGLEELLQLHPAEMLTAPAAQQLLLAAIDTAAASGSVFAFHLLHTQLPAVNELTAAQVIVLLSSAINLNEVLSQHLVMQLKHFQASQFVGSSCILQLLNQALQQKRVGAVRWLCSFQGAHGPSRHSCERLLALANRQGVLHKVAQPLFVAHGAVHPRLLLAAVASAVVAADVAAVADLVAGANTGPSQGFQALYWPHVIGWLADAAGQHQRAMVAALCKFQVRQPQHCPASEGVEGLLQRAVQAKDYEGVRILVEEVLNSSSICSAEQAVRAVAQQMQAAVKQGDVQLLRCLASSKAAEEIDVCSMTGFIWWTLQHGQLEPTKVLLELRCAELCISSCKALRGAVESSSYKAAAASAGEQKAVSQPEGVPAAASAQGQQLPLQVGQ
jgi:hypothetical protein